MGQTWWAHGQAGQGCGELEPNPAALFLGQVLMVPGVDMGCWAVGSRGHCCEAM